MQVTASDRDALRRLGDELAEIARLPEQQEIIGLWKALNSLKPVRPMVIIDQMPWNEMEINGELTLQCEHPFCRALETQLRRSLYRWKHAPGDLAIQPEIVVSKVIRNSGYGIEVEERTSALDIGNDVVGHYYVDQLKTDADIEKIHAPEVSLDTSATAECEEAAHEIFDDVLNVRMQGMLPWLGPWDTIVQWCGVEGTLFDLSDRPEFMHRLVERLVDAYLAMLESAEEQGLLGHGQNEVHCTGAWTDELPAPGFDPDRPRTQDLWTFGMAQIFSSVSPAMFDEFEVPYMQRIYSRFGLGYYGCCDPLDDRIDLVRKIPNVRKISMSPWVNQERGARQIGPDYVFSRKPSPALLATDRFSPSAVEEDLRETIRVCKEHGCPLELILKDISTVRYEPQRLTEWDSIARRLVNES